MYLEEILTLKNEQLTKIKCDICGKHFDIMVKNAILNIKRNQGKHKCRSCSYKEHLKPQNTKEYWTVDKKTEHSNIIKSSEKYYESLKNRDLYGEKNGMYGKTHTAETKKKMSVSRTGKIGKDATAWKGGKTTLTKRIKKFIQRKYKWFTNVIKRDKICQHCYCNNSKLDAHHIIPMSILIKNLLVDTQFETEDEKFLYLSEHEDIIDINLKNGIALCRVCHKRIHTNWGSHEPRTGKQDEII